MITQDLLKYIEGELTKGTPKEIIQSNLLSGGWDANDVAEGLSAIFQKNSAIPPPPAINNINLQSAPQFSKPVQNYQETATSSKKSRLPVLSILIILTMCIIGGGVFAYYKFFNLKNSANTQDANKISEATTFAGVEIPELDIKFSKSTYNVGESFTGGENYMKYQGPSKTVIVLYGESRNGFPKTYYQMTRGIMYDIDFSDQNKTGYLKVAVRAFKLDSNVYSVGQNSFSDAGVYTYSIVVYDCKDVEKTLNKNNCGGDLQNIDHESLTSIKPLNSISKEITVVTEGKTNSATKSFDCNTDENCFYNQLKTCAVSTTEIPANPLGIRFKLNILSQENNNCVVKITNTEFPQQYVQLKNTEMTCKIPMGIERGTMVNNISKQNCTDSLVNLFSANNELSGAIFLILNWGNMDIEYSGSLTPTN